MKKAFLVLISLIVSITSFGQVRQVKNAFKGFKSSTATGIVATEAMKAAKNAQKALSSSAPAGKRLDKTPKTQLTPPSINRFEVITLPTPKSFTTPSQPKPNSSEVGEELPKDSFEFTQNVEVDKRNDEIEEFVSTRLQELMDAGRYEDALALFSSEPLSSFPENNATVALNLCEASLNLRNIEKFNYYLQCAKKIDCDLGREYTKHYYQKCYDMLIEDPTDWELADWVIDTSEQPVEIVALLFPDIVERHFPDTDVLATFDWSDMSDYNPDELEIISSMIHIGLTSIKNDGERSDSLVRDHLIFNIALWMTVDPTEIENSEKYINYLSEKIEKDPDPKLNNLRVLLIYAQAYIAAHGMDHPKKAYEILTKEKKNIEKLTLDPSVKMMYWEYLRAVCEAIGNKRGVKSCNSVIASMQKEVDAAENSIN